MQDENVQLAQVNQDLKEDNTKWKKEVVRFRTYLQAILNVGGLPIPSCVSRFCGVGKLVSIRWRFRTHAKPSCPPTSYDSRTHPPNPSKGILQDPRICVGHVVEMGGTVHCIAARIEVRPSYPYEATTTRSCKHDIRPSGEASGFGCGNPLWDPHGCTAISDRANDEERMTAAFRGSATTRPFFFFMAWWASPHRATACPSFPSVVFGIPGTHAGR